MAVEIGGKQNSPQVGMSFKLNSQKVVGFTLMLIGCSPKGRYGRNSGIVLREQNFQPEPIMMCRGK